MNWGNWIFVVIVLFMIGTLTMVYIAMNQDFPLVTENYYQQELDHDNKIKRIQNHRAHGYVDMILNKRSLSISTIKENVSLKLHLYRPSNANLDKHFEFVLNNEANHIDLDAITKGLYIAKLSYSINEMDYYTEKEVMVK